MPKLKRGKEIVNMTPQQALMVKIISGDASDNIKSIRPKVGEITAFKYITEKTEEFKKLLKENPEVAQRFVLNSKLVDFKNIPVELSQRVVDEFYSLKNW